MDDAQVRELQSVTPELAALYFEGSGAIADAADEEALEEVRVRLLGRKSPLTQVLRSIPTLPPEQRPLVGRLGNLVRAELEKLADERREALKRAALSASLAGERIDVTLPGLPFPAGHEHLISQTMREVEDIFIGLGYRIAEGPEVELDYYNFTALNTPPGHPARCLPRHVLGGGAVRETMPEAVVDADRGVLLRTHTSPVQVRVMESQRPPVYIVVPGQGLPSRRHDATHGVMFHQVEGLYVDEGVTMSDLRTCLDQFAKAYFGPAVATRFPPTSSPSPNRAPKSISPAMCNGTGCPILQKPGWVETSGGGMVDPTVFAAPSATTREVDRLRVRHGGRTDRHEPARLPDLRLLFENNVRFLRQF